MRIVYLADARSPIARNWIKYFVDHGHRVVVISSHPCPADGVPGATVIPVPLAFWGWSSGLAREGMSGSDRPPRWAPLMARLRAGTASTVVRGAWIRLAPFEIYRHVGKIRALLEDLEPDLVHAMRLPFEGIAAASAMPTKTPLLISVWGNDLTLFASRRLAIGRQVRSALRRADALHCDCQRDLDLAPRWGFEPGKPCAVMPGAGGIDIEVFSPGPASDVLRAQLQIPPEAPVVINPRGYRSYVRNDAFFRALPRVLNEHPAAVAVCSAMQGNRTMERWVARLGLARHVRLLPSVAHHEMADVFRLGAVSVSPTVHDGTPNSLLEAMACGCFPVAGDVASLREWITPGSNGLLCDPTSPAAIAAAILQALGDRGLRERAQRHNLQLIRDRAQYGHVMKRAEELYHQVVGRARR
jgi:glycosyltransferase involved in cell wall biosynthesis